MKTDLRIPRRARWLFVVAVRLARFAVDSNSDPTEAMADLATDGAIDVALDDQVGLRHITHFLPKFKRSKTKLTKKGGNHGSI